MAKIGIAASQLFGNRSGSGLSGMTAGQIPVAATPTTVTSSIGTTGTGAVVLATSPTLTGILTVPAIEALGTALTLSQTGDIYGETAIVLKNRSGANGGAFQNLGLPLVDLLLQAVGNISTVAITSNVLTLTFSNSFTYVSWPVGLALELFDLTTATFLNGQTITVSTSTPTTLTAAFTHANYAPAQDTGTAVAQGNVRLETRSALLLNAVNTAGEIQFLDGASGVFFAAFGAVASTISTPLRVPAILSSSANYAASGVLRLATANSIGWRNAANTADVLLGKDANDNLTFAGSAITLHGVTASIGGSALPVGTAATGTVVITGASAAVAAGKCICVTPNTFPGASFSWNRAYISATDTVTVQVFADVAGTPTASTYNVTIV